MFTEKIAALTAQYNELVSKRSTLLADAEKAVNGDGDLNITEIRSQITKLNGQIDGKNTNIEELRALEDEANEKRSLIDTKKHAKKADKLELRSSLNKYLHNETRAVEGFTSTDGTLTIPKSINYVPEHEVATVMDLSKLLQHYSAQTASGTYPIVKRADQALISVKELEKNPELAKPVFTKVDWAVETYRGAIPISRESIDDSAADLVGVIATNAEEQKVNATNKKVSEILKSFAAKEIKTVDDVKKIFNVDLDPAYQKVIVASQSFYQFLDTLKDGNGRYLLQDSIVAGSPATLLGKPVYIVGDDLLGVAGEAHAFIGDIKRAALFVDRLDIQVKWVDDNIGGQYIQAFLRFGVAKLDEKAGYFVTAPVTDPKI